MALVSAARPAAFAVLAAAGGEGQVQVEHRQFMGFDEQHLAAFGGFPGLHVQGAVRRRLAVQLGQGLQLVSGLGLVQGLAGLGVARIEQIKADTARRDGEGQGEQGETWPLGLTHWALSSGNTWATLRRSRVK